MIATLAQMTSGAPLEGPLTAMDIVLSLVKIGVIVVLLLTGFAYMTWFERRVLARMQWRLGPNRVGPAGLLQPVADGLKVLFKEQLIPTNARPFLYLLAPILSVTVALSVFAVIPFGGTEPWNFFGVKIAPWIADIDVGLLYVLGVTSVGVYGFVLAGWSSGNHYALLGGIRSTAQVISYELAMGMALLSPLLLSAVFTDDGLGTLSLRELVAAQEQGGWFILYLPFSFLIFWVAGIAETNRAPFDLPEAEQELIAGYHTEYGGMRFALFFMAEYIAMISMSALGSTVFLGGAGSPFRTLFVTFGFEPPAALWPLTMPGPWWFLLKILAFMFVFVWLRATMPRFRYDQLMRLGWQVMLPLALANVVLCAVFVALGWPPGPTKWSILAASALFIAILSVLGAARRRASQAILRGARA